MNEMTRENVIKGLRGLHGSKETMKLISDTIKLLKEQEPKTGHWFISEYEFLTCSCCGESYYTGKESTENAKQGLANGDYYKFCPHCGAKMEGR